MPLAIMIVTVMLVPNATGHEKLNHVGVIFYPIFPMNCWFAVMEEGDFLTVGDFRNSKFGGWPVTHDTHGDEAPVFNRTIDHRIVDCNDPGLHGTIGCNEKSLFQAVEHILKRLWNCESVIDVVRW